MSNLRIGVFQDKLGITDNYNHAWHEMLLKAGLISPRYSFLKFKSYNHFHQTQLIQWKGNRKSPGFVEDPAFQVRILNWVKESIEKHRINFCIFMDPALFFIVNQKWEQATSETLRGGIYQIQIFDGRTIPILVTIPISSINRQMKPKDIAALNNGFADYEEWRSVFKSDEDDESDDDEVDELSEVHQMEWYAPMIVPYGRFCLQSDLTKLGMIIRQQERALANVITRTQVTG